MTDREKIIEAILEHLDPNDETILKEVFEDAEDFEALDREIERLRADIKALA